MSIKKEITKRLIDVMVNTNSMTDHMLKKVLTDEEVKQAYDETLSSKDIETQKQTKNKMADYINRKLQKSIRSLTAMTESDKLQIENYTKSYLSEDIKSFSSLQEMSNFLGNFVKLKYRANSKNDREFMEKNLGENLNNGETYKSMTELLNRENTISPQVIKMIDDLFLNMEKSYDKGFGFVLQVDANKALINEIEKSDPKLIMNNQTMQWFTEIYTERIYPNEAAKNVIGNIDKSFEVIKKYIDLATQIDKGAVIHNDAISHIVRMAEMGKLPEGQKEEIEEILDKNLQRSNIPMPNMEKYEEIVANKNPMNDEQFKNFIFDIYNIRNRNGAIPERFCDYIISQKLDTQSSINKEKPKYFPILKRAIEDKSIYELQRNGISDVNVKIIEPDMDLDKFMKDYAGAQTNFTNNIKIKSDTVYNFSKNNTHATNTMFHEIEHAIQHKKMNENLKVGKYAYLMIKENVIREHYPQFYDDNYSNIQSEIDARIQGAIKSSKYLKSLGMTDKEIIMSDYNTNIKRIKSEIELREKVKDKKIEGKKQSIDDVFQDIVKQYPGLINAYPILGLEFDSFGNRKNYMEIIQDYEEEVKNSDEQSFDEKNDKGTYEKIDVDSNSKNSKVSVYLEILKNDSKISNSDIVSDIEALNKVEVDTEIGKMFRGIVIREKLLPKFNEWKKIGKIDYVSEFDPSLNITEHAGEIKDFEKVKANLYYFSMKNPELSESKLIQKELQGLEINKEYIAEIEKKDEEQKENCTAVKTIKLELEEFVSEEQTSIGDISIKDVSESGANNTNTTDIERQQLQNIDSMVNSEERNEGMTIIETIKYKEEKDSNISKDDIEINE